MANTKVFSVLLLALLAISLIAEVSARNGHGGHHPPGVGHHGYVDGSLTPSQCSPQCIRRCSNTQYRNNCMLFCQKCCKKCLCVPRGTYGNKQTCSCYNNWKTQEGGPKCP